MFLFAKKCLIKQSNGSEISGFSLILTLTIYMYTCQQFNNHGKLRTFENNHN